MARDFDGTNDNITKTTGATVLDVDLKSVMVWFKSSVIGDEADTIFLDASAVSSGNFRQTIVETIVGGETHASVATNWTGDNGQWRGDTDITTGLWVAICVSYDRSSTANDAVIHTDGVSNTITEQVTPTLVARTGQTAWRMGENVGGGGDLEAELSNVAVWDVVLSSNEISAMSNGVNPFIIRNSNLLLLTPLYGNQSPEPEWGGNDLEGTVNGATKALTNPPVQLLSRYMSGH